MLLPIFQLQFTLAVKIEDNFGALMNSFINSVLRGAFEIERINRLLMRNLLDGYGVRVVERISDIGECE